MDCDVVVVGAGAAGLAASGALVKAGQRVCCLEASNRIGGRIYTIHDPLSPIPIELGAEFIHGRAPEIWDRVGSAGLGVYEHSVHAVYLEEGRVRSHEDTGDAAEKLVSKSAATSRHDEPFSDVVERSRMTPQAKERAIAFVEGFNAARKERISTAALKRDAKAAEKIEGERAFRILNGYQALPLALLHEIPGYSQVVQLDMSVEAIEWRGGKVQVHARPEHAGSSVRIDCRKAIVTVSLGVLKAAGAIELRPEVQTIREAARQLEFGQVYRVTFRFGNPFWEDDERLATTGFIISREKHFPTWWTAYPVIAPMLTGWSAGPAGESLQGFTRQEVISEALASLSRILNREIPRPAAAYFHDWHADPLHRGAYSYVPAGAMEARNQLAEPVDDTLFFAGEATNNAGHGGTVHGAIAAGIEAARKALVS